MAANNKEIVSRVVAGIGTMKKLAPKVTDTFLAFDKAAVEPGALDVKTKELIAVALAVGARCDGCIAIHVGNALKAGAKPEEIGEALGVAVSLGGGPSMIYATRALEAVAEFTSK